MTSIGRKTLLLCAAAALSLGVIAYGLGAKSARMNNVHDIASPESAGPAPKELALYMGELQRLMHKLTLSVAAENAPLAEFYREEAVEQLRTIQKELPEYEHLPVALLIDRMSLPTFDELGAALTTKPADVHWDRVGESLRGVVQSCNACHAATQHAFIKIVPGSDVNPFNQDFRP